jgi:hypothetical protein
MGPLLQPLVDGPPLGVAVSGAVMGSLLVNHVQDLTRAVTDWSAHNFRELPKDPIAGLSFAARERGAECGSPPLG